jgi:polyisoprenoid-binding protein YceI
MKRVVVLTLLATLILAGCSLLQQPEEAGAPIEAVALDEAAASASAVRFQIVPGESTVRFELDEILRGQPNSVVGATDQIAGELALDLSVPADVQMGTVQINARALQTDSGMRDRQIENRILETGAYEFISFTPTAVTGVPESVNVGDEVTFSIAGDLTIRDVTNPVTFTVVAVLESEGEISGTASAVIQRADYNLQIPNVPSVAEVEEEVELYIDFVARAGG